MPAFSLGTMFCGTAEPLRAGGSGSSRGRARFSGRGRTSRQQAVVVRAEKVAVTGATGLVGRQLVKQLVARGDEVRVLTRDTEAARSSLGSFNALSFYGKRDWQEGIAGSRAVINLAGEPISTRWSESVKQEILDSRVNTTQYLSDLIRGIEQPADRPEVFVSGSAIGFYGTSLTETFTEDSPSGGDFLASVCQKWEAAAHSATSGNPASSSSAGDDGDDDGAKGPRVVCVRTGLVLSKEGGVLGKMLPLFNLFVGSPLGSGSQWMSWVHRDDLVSLLLACADDSRYAGAVNGTAPQPVTMRVFSETLALVLKRPMFMPPVPDLPLQVLLGEGAVLVLEGQKVVPKKATDLGFTFQYPQIKQALEHASKF